MAALCPGGGASGEVRFGPANANADSRAGLALAAPLKAVRVKPNKGQTK